MPSRAQRLLPPHGKLIHTATRADHISKRPARDLKKRTKDEPVHGRRVRDDAHQVRRETAVQRAHALLGKHDPEGLDEPEVLAHAVGRRGLSQACAQDLRRWREQVGPRTSADERGGGRSKERAS